MRYSVVAHSFRVMAKSRNYDEMVVGMMHDMYSLSCYTRGLFSCDVEGDSKWEEALKLFIWPVKKFKTRGEEDIPDEELLACNMPRGLSAKEKEEWMLMETKWSQKYRKRLLRIGKNRLARRVMIYDLEDRLEVLRNQHALGMEPFIDIFISPWKKHWEVDVIRGSSCIECTLIPRTYDKILLRKPTEEERNNLIVKYTRGLELLRQMEPADFSESDYTDERVAKNADTLKRWFSEWLTREIADEDDYDDGVLSCNH